MSGQIPFGRFPIGYRSVTNPADLAVTFYGQNRLYARSNSPSF